MKSTFYERLGVEPACEPDAIRKAFRAIAKESHPDRDPTPEALSRFLSAKEAYETLSDPAARKVYDAELQNLCSSCHAEPAVPGGRRCLRCLVFDAAKTHAKDKVDRHDREVIGRKKRTTRRPIVEEPRRPGRTVDVDMSDILPEPTVDDYGGSGPVSADDLLAALLAESAVRSSFDKKSKRPKKSKRSKVLFEVEVGDAKIRLKADPESMTHLDRSLEGASWFLGMLKKIL